MMVPLSWMMSLLFSPFGDRVWVGPGIGALPRMETNRCGLAGEEGGCVSPSRSPAPRADRACRLLAARSSLLLFGSRPALSRPALPAADVKAPAAAPWSRGPAHPHSNPLTHHLVLISAGPRRDHASGSKQAPGQAYIWHVKPQATPGPPRRLAWV